MKKITVVLMAMIGLSGFCSEEVKIRNYEVSPGSYAKSYGTSQDLDLVVDKDGKVHRKGLLTDGKVFYGRTWCVCYVFWRVPDKDAFISVDLTLEKPSEIEKVEVYGCNDSPMYAVTKARLEDLGDGISTDVLSESDQPVFNRTVWKMTLDGKNQKTGNLKVTVWTGGSKYLHLTEIKVWKRSPGNKQKQ